MKDRACAKAEGKCQDCGGATDRSHGEVHHKTYWRGCYDVAVEEAMEQGKCVWVCFACHGRRHEGIARARAAREERERQKRQWKPRKISKGVG